MLCHLAPFFQPGRTCSNSLEKPLRAVDSNVKINEPHGCITVWARVKALMFCVFFFFFRKREKEERRRGERKRRGRKEEGRTEHVWGGGEVN